MQTFGQFEAAVRALAFPAGEAVNLAAKHRTSIIEGLADLQEWVPCLRYENTNVSPQCATHYQCGLTVLPAPPGVITKLSVMDKINPTTGLEDATAEDDWCSEIVYAQINGCHIRDYLDRAGRGCCGSMPLYFGLPSELCRRYPTPTDEGLPAGLPRLPLGFHYPQESTDRTWGRVRQGRWAIMNGRIYIVPWIQSTQTVIVRWEGIKNEWYDGDPFTSDPLVAQAMREWVLAQAARPGEGNDPEAVAVYERDYGFSRMKLLRQCQERTRIRDCQTSQAAGALGSSTMLFFNDVQQATADCPAGTTGNSVTVTIEAGTVGSATSKADANARAKQEAEQQAADQLVCLETPVVYENTNGGQSITESCQGEADAPIPDGDPVTIVIESGVTSPVSVAAANTVAEATARARARGQLSCTFWNRAVALTATCANASTVPVNIAAHTYSAESQAAADAIAQAKAIEQGGIDCGDGSPNTEQLCQESGATFICKCKAGSGWDCATGIPDGTLVLGLVIVRVTVAAGRFFAGTVEEANNMAKAAGDAYVHAKWLELAAATEPFDCGNHDFTLP